MTVPSKKIYSIQMLRGIAALSVVIAHSSHKISQMGVENTFGFSFLGFGVDIFFIVSGFVMMYITDRNGTAVNNDYLRLVSSFIKDRVIRIIPLYWFFTLLSLCVFLVLPDMVNSSGGGTGIIQSFLLLPVPTGTKFLIQNGWTLTYEFLFYIPFAALMLSGKYQKIIGVILFFVLIDILSGIWQSDNFASYSIKYEFVLGMAIYLFYTGKLYQSLTVAIVAFFLAYLNAGDQGRVFHEGIAAFIVVLIAVSSEKFLLKVIFYLRPLIFLGDISYSLYLSHPFILQGISVIFKRLHFNMLGIFLYCIMITFSILLGYLCFVFLERNMIYFFKKTKRESKSQDTSA
jgi:peptidoglycan/LPS O-acetylase OafA/YrhL